MLDAETNGARTGVTDHGLVACRECDAIQTMPPLAPGEALACFRCGAHLRRPRAEALDRVLPLTLAAIVFFALANMRPIVAIEVAGNRSSTSLLGTGVELYRQGATGVAVLVMLTGFVAPAVQLIMLAYSLSALAVRRRLWGLRAIARLSAAVPPWSMVEVFMLGALVSLVKLAGLARVIPGIGLWSLFGVIVLTAAAHAALDTPSYWEKVERIQ